MFSVTITHDGNGWLDVRDADTGKRYDTLPTDQAIDSNTDSHAIAERVAAALGHKVISVAHDREFIHVALTVTDASGNEVAE